jgi:lycopene cyclase domain-containing protein
MKEYTIAALAAVVLVVLLDRILRTHLLARREYWVCICILFCFKVLVNGYLTARPIVLYGEDFTLGVRLYTIPVEDFFYGYSLITASLVLWEYFKRTTRGDQAA